MRPALRRVPHSGRSEAGQGLAFDTCRQALSALCEACAVCAQEVKCAARPGGQGLAEHTYSQVLSEGCVCSGVSAVCQSEEAPGSAAHTCRQAHDALICFQQCAAQTLPRCDAL